MIEIDGSYGEGGGQLVRSAVALAALTGKPLRLVNVRAKRARPGLAAQHLAAVRAVATACGAHCEGLELRSTTLVFEPRAAGRGGELRIDVGTAGSVTLVLQALLPVLFRADRASRVTVTGGTDVPRSPSWDYFCQVLLPLLARMGLHASAMLVRRGYYPGGGGEVSVAVQPGVPRGLVLEAASGHTWRIGGEAHVANLPLSIAERMRDAALRALARRAAVGTRALGPESATGIGGGITLWALGEAGVLGAARVAQRGVRAEALGKSAGAELAADLESGAALDMHGADQVLVYVAMASGPSRFTVRTLTSHAKTALWLIEQFLPVRFAVAQRGALILVETRFDMHQALPGGQT